MSVVTLVVPLLLGPEVEAGHGGPYVSPRPREEARSDRIFDWEVRDYGRPQIVREPANAISTHINYLDSKLYYLIYYGYTGSTLSAHTSTMQDLITIKHSKLINFSVNGLPQINKQTKLDPTRVYKRGKNPTKNPPLPRW